MTKHECAVVMAYTGVTMLQGDDFGIFHKYCEDLIGHPIYTHEFPFYADKIKEMATEKKAIKAANLEPQERLFVDIEYYLGLRPGEARALQPKDFDLKNRTVSITKSVALSADNPILKGTKTGVSRTIPVPDVLLAEIREYNTHFRGLYYFVDEEGNLFNRCRFNAFRERIFRKINEELGGNKNIDALNGMNFYTFRHNRATELYYLQGVSTKKKAEYMGHSELMFIKTYSHLDDSREAEELLRAVTNL